MFGRKCSLCGGKLDSRNICKECGLDNRKSEKYYKINRNSCDDKPLTHVHEERSEPKRKKNPQKGKINALASIITIAAIIIPAMIGIFENVTDSSPEPEYYANGYDPYAYLEKEHPKFGEQMSYPLKSGQYIVGVHIAEGDYSATVFDDFDSIAVSDEENSIYLYEYQAAEGNFLEDLRLFNGAVVTITSSEGMVLKTKNGQPQTQVNAIENPLKDSILLEKNQETEVGTDFEAGVYDVYIFDEYGYVNLTMMDEDGEEWDLAGYELGQNGVYGTCFRNMVLLEGMRIYVEEAGAELIPSDMISSGDYSEYYQKL